MKITIAIGLLMVLSLCGFSACSSIQTQHQQIAAACESAASAADAVAAGAEAGKVTTAQAQQAVKVYRVTVPFCEPQPRESLGSADYTLLIESAAQLATIAREAK